MLFGVPQFTNIEDKIVGPFTGKHLLWLGLMVGILLVLWFFLERAVFFIVGIPIALIFLGLAFVRPNNQSMIGFIGSVGSFLFSSKIYVWKREEYKKENFKKEKKEVVEKKTEKKDISEDKIKELAKVLDLKKIGYNKDKNKPELKNEGSNSGKTENFGDLLNKSKEK